MSLPFQTNNPYGGYFGWNEEAYSYQSGLGSTPLGFGPGMISAMGGAVGGFNPTAAEFRSNRSRDIAYQQFLARSLAQDQRAQSLSQAFLQSMPSQSASRAFQDRMGGIGNINSLISFGLNMPGIAEYIGGSQRSLAFGSLAAAGGGLGMMGTPTFGQDPLHLMFAENLQRQVMSRYIMPGGAMNLSASQGLNRDQLGGILGLGASQGAFAGLDMGKLEGADQKAKFLANSDTINKIDRFLSNSAKALGNLMDVYGKLSTAELATKAQQITGLDFSRLGNPELIQQRLNSLRTTAEATGLDYQTMFDLSARAGDTARAFGLPGGFGSFVAQESAYNARLRQRDQNTAGFFFAQPDIMEDQTRRMRDLAGMARDPMGARMAALELMMQYSGVDGQEAAGIRSRFSGLPANQQSISSLDQFMTQRFGLSAPAFIQGMGGPSGVLQNIDPARQLGLTSAMNEQFRQRQLVQIERMAMYTGISDPAARQAGMALYSNMSAGDLDKLLQGGNVADAAMNSARDAFLGGGGTLAKMRALRAAVNQNPLTSGFQSISDQRTAAEMRLYSTTYRARDFGALDNMRGQYSPGNFGNALWSQLAGTDTVSMLNVMATLHPNSVFGFKDKGLSIDRGEWLERGWLKNTGGGLQFSSAGFDEWRGQVNRLTQSGFANTDAGRKLLGIAGLGGGVNDESLVQSFKFFTDPVALSQGTLDAGVGTSLDHSGAYGRLMLHTAAGLEATRQSAPMRSLIAALGKPQDWKILSATDVFNAWQVLKIVSGADAFNDQQLRLSGMTQMSAQLDNLADPDQRQKVSERMAAMASQSIVWQVQHGGWKKFMDNKFFISPEIGDMVGKALDETLSQIDQGTGEFKDMSQKERDKRRDTIIARRNELQMSKGLDLDSGESMIRGTLTLQGAALDLVGKIVKGKDRSGEEAVGKK